MVAYAEVVKNAMKKWVDLEVMLIDRSDNEEADTLAKLVSMSCPSDRRWIQVDAIITLVIEESNLLMIDCDLEDWGISIKKHILEGEIPKDPIGKRKIKNKTTHFTIIREELYKRSLLEGSPLKICKTKKEGEMVARSICHGGGWAHQGPKNMTKPIYWIVI